MRTIILSFISFSILILTFGLNATEPFKHLNADYLTFKSDEPGKTNLEVYFTLDNSEIQFITFKDLYKAVIESDIIITDQYSNAVKGQTFTQDFFSEDFNSTIDRSIENTIKFVFDLYPGEYQVKINVRDNISNNEFKSVLNVPVPNYGDGNLTISSIQLSKTSNTQVPNIPKIFYYFEPEISFYFEAYNTKGNENVCSLNTFYTISTVNGEEKIKASEVLYAKNNSQGFISKFKFHTLPSGEYIFTINQIDNNSKKQATSQTSFKIIQSPTNLRFEDYTEVLDKLKYIANKDVIDSLKLLPVKQRQNGINNFWAKRDPDPETEKNELMIEYYSRINIANKSFSIGDFPGWKTDLGLIFILFGAPDYIYKSEDSFAEASFQIWNYKSLSLYFYFEARNCLSDYILQNKGYVYANYLPD